MKKWFVFNLNVEADQVEIMIYGQIGKDYFDNSGVGAEDFANSLKEIPKNKNILLRIHSPGGSVWDGLAIYNLIKQRRDYVTAQIDGIAFSAASFIAMAAKTVRIPKTGRMMIHDASGMTFGNAEDMRELAELLDQESDNIAAIYAEKTGRSKSSIRQMMKETTWMTGAEAVEKGFADEVVSDATPLENSFDLSVFRNVPVDVNRVAPASRGSEDPQTPPPQPANPSVLAGRGGTPTNPTTNSVPPQQQDAPTNIMKREKLIALLNKHSIKFDAAATDEQLVALVDSIPTAAAPATTTTTVPAPATATADLSAITAELQSLRNERNAERKLRIEREIENCAGIPVNDRAAWVQRAMADESIVAFARTIPAQQVGQEPVTNVEVVSEDPRVLEKSILNLWGKGSHDPIVAKQRGNKRGEIINKNIAKLVPYIANAGTNTVHADLKRTVILQQMIRAFAIRVLPLQAFSTVFNGIRLEGTDKVTVPYFALDTTASTDFVIANGYDTFGDTAASVKTITVDKRKYQGLFWTSAELARQPFMDIGTSAMLKGEQLGIDVVNDVLSLVTNANYGAAAHTGLAANFDAADVADLKGVADLANWPGAGRSLMLNSTYDVSLLKDSTVKSALNFGDASPIQDGAIKKILGFSYVPDSRVPANGENLVGFIAFKSALLVAFSPVDPTPEVRNLLTRYEVVTEPGTGVSFEYRLWGDADKDRSKEIIEANYGRVAGEAAALKRIVSS